MCALNFTYKQNSLILLIYCGDTEYLPRLCFPNVFPSHSHLCKKVQCDEQQSVSHIHVHTEIVCLELLAMKCE